MKKCLQISKYGQKLIAKRTKNMQKLVKYAQKVYNTKFDY